MAAMFAGSTAGRAPITPARDEKQEHKLTAAEKRAVEAIEEAKEKAKKKAEETPPAPEKPQAQYKEGKIYRDPTTGIRKRYVNGQWAAVA